MKTFRVELNIYTIRYPIQSMEMVKASNYGAAIARALRMPTTKAKLKRKRITGITAKAYAV